MTSEQNEQVGGRTGQKTFRARVVVMLKAGVLDAQGLTIARALDGLGFSAVKTVRVGKEFELVIEAPDAAAASDVADRSARKLLANLVIETFRVDAVEEM